MTETEEPINEVDWLPAAEALRRVSQIMTEYQARHAITDRAYDGLVRARARRFVKHRDVFDDVALPKEFWWAGAHDALEQNWPAGTFPPGSGRCTTGRHMIVQVDSRQLSAW